MSLLMLILTIGPFIAQIKLKQKKNGIMGNKTIAKECLMTKVYVLK